MRFQIRALGADNRIEQLTLDALDEAAATQELARQHLNVLAIRPAATWPLADRKAPSFALLLFAQELLALLRAGLSLIECIEALAEKQPAGTQRRVLGQLLEALRQGRRLSAALSERPDVFPPLFVGLVQAAEGTSDLPRAIGRYIEYRERVDQVRNKLVSASVYPCILLVVGAAVIGFLLGYVVPKFALVYRSSGREMPWLTEALMDAGRVVGTHPTVALLLVGAVVGCVALAVRHLMRSGRWFDALTWLPGLGAQLRVFALSRQYMTLALLLQGGIALVPALRTATTTAIGPVRDGLVRTGERIARGEPLSDAMAAEQLTTPISLRLLRAGERTGDLGGMLRQAAEFHDGDTARFIDRFTRAVEPTLMAAIGLVVGAVVVLLYMPIFDLAGSLG